MDRDDVKDKIDDAAREGRKATDKVADKSKDLAHETGDKLKKAGEELKSK